MLTAKVRFRRCVVCAQCQQRPGQWRAPATSASVLSIQDGAPGHLCSKAYALYPGVIQGPACERVHILWSVHLLLVSAVCCNLQALSCACLDVVQTTLLVQAHTRVFADSTREMWLLDDEDAGQDGNTGHPEQALLGWLTSCSISVLGSSSGSTTCST